MATAAHMRTPLHWWIVGILSGLLGVTLFLASIQRLE